MLSNSCQTMKVYLAISLVLLSTSVESKKECVKRQGKNTPYCVCNATYCDDLDPIVKQAKGTVLMFETNKQGDRFKETRLQFNKTDVQSNETVILGINRNRLYQKIKGFGAAFTDSAGINLNLLPKELGNNAIKDYFGANGIEFSMARVPIGGCDFSPRGYTYDDVKDDFELKHFSLQKEDLEDKIPYIKQALNISTHKLKLYGSTWSSPAWMKTDNKLVGTGSLIGKPGEKYYKTWANYFVKFLDSYKQHGIVFWGLTTENEPGNAGIDHSHPPLPTAWNGLGLSPENARDWVKMDLGPALAKAGYTPDRLNLMVYDNGAGDGIDLFDYVHTCFNDSQAYKYLKGIAYHCYGQNDKTWLTLDILNSLYPNNFIMMTECCQEFTAQIPGYIQKTGNWDNAEGYARDIINILNHWGVGWVEWNLALDMHGLPHWSGMMGEAPIMVNTTSKEYYKDAKFYTIGQFSKFLVPDSVRIHLDSGRHFSNDLNGVSFLRPDGATVVVIFNSHNQDLNIKIDDHDYGHLYSKIRSHSVQTYIYWK